VANDPWTVLGVDASAGFAEARRAYLVRSQLLHPDRHQGAVPEVMAEAERAMRELNDAWQAVRAHFAEPGPATPSGVRRDGHRAPSDRADQPAGELSPELSLDWVVGRLVNAARVHGDPLAPEEIDRLRLPVAAAPTGRRFERWLARRRLTLREAIADDTRRKDGMEKWTRAVRVLSESGPRVVFMLLLDRHQG
jgi:hypothetical protein